MWQPSIGGTIDSCPEIDPAEAAAVGEGQTGDRRETMTVPGVREHHLRHELVMELHARPAPPLEAPEAISFIAVLRDENAAAADDRAHLARLCERYDVAPPPPGANHFYADLGPFRIKWEGHTEFSDYAFFRRGPFEDPFEHPVIELVPRDWLEGLPGRLVEAAHLALEPRDAPERTADDIDRLFGGNPVAASKVTGGAAIAWTDFHLHEDGFSRILVRDRGMSPRQAGRLAQRLLEINAYRLMALLALPSAREAGTRMREIGAQLSNAAARTADSKAPATDAELLDELSDLAAEIEKMGALHSYRLRAARAYYSLVLRRLEELREQRIEGNQMISEFLDRRLSPAMATCESTAERQEALAERAGRVTSLLRARVEVGLEDQNRRLLESMNRRARLQLRLQETVEGLSVVAISYYLVGLVGYALKGLKDAGAPVNVTLGTGLAVPVVVLLVWFGLKRMRRKLIARGD